MTAENEGYLALAISTLGFKSVEDSFRLISNCNERDNRGWTEEELNDIEKMRAIGMTWRDISDSFGRSASTINKAYMRWQRGRTD